MGHCTSRGLHLGQHRLGSPSEGTHDASLAQPPSIVGSCSSPAVQTLTHTWPWSAPTGAEQNANRSQSSLQLSGSKLQSSPMGTGESATGKQWATARSKTPSMSSGTQWKPAGQLPGPSNEHTCRPSGWAHDSGGSPEVSPVTEPVSDVDEPPVDVDPEAVPSAPEPALLLPIWPVDASLPPSPMGST